MKPGARTMSRGMEARLCIKDIWGLKSAVTASLGGIKEKSQGLAGFWPH